MSAKLAIAALKTRLATIQTTLTGRAALETTSAKLPVITLYSTGDSRASLQEYDDLVFTRTLMIELKIAASPIYDEQLDDGLLSIRSVIKQDVNGDWLGGNALRVQETNASFFPPALNSADCVLQVSIEFDYYAGA